MTSAQAVATVVAVYAAYSWAFRQVLADAEARGCRVGPRWLGLLVGWLLNAYSEFVGVRIASEYVEEELDPSQRYMIVWHPHGCLAWSAMFLLGRKAVLGQPHGREWFPVIASALFQLPFWGEAILLLNGRRVDHHAMESMLSSGASIAVEPGGVREQLLTRHDQEIIIFSAKLGFIRSAIRNGVDHLLPCYMFNETQLFRRVPGWEHVSDQIFRATGFGLPVMTGRFGLLMAALLPLTTDIHVRWGKPVPVGPAEPDPSNERVEQLFGTYVAAVQELFDRHAAKCLPADVAARGLKVVRLPPRQA